MGTRTTRTLVCGLLLGAALAWSPEVASAADPLSSAQKEEVERILRDYILKNPEVIVESLQGYEERQRQAAEKEAEKAVAANQDTLLRDPAAPVGGNPKGDVTIVEFFDYRCGYCKKVVSSLQELMKSDGNIRIVFKEFPILGPDSAAAAQAALAAWKLAPDKYVAYHVALMETRGELNEARILETARKVGIDSEKLKAAKADPEIKLAIDRNMALAKALQISGTPAFVIGDQLVPGAVDLATLRQMVKDARSS